MTNLYSRRTGDPEGCNEIHGCVRFMMNAIRETTPNHYNAMLRG